ncbi:hypothetical protein K491DRAFT_281848 [Lophiostoma macrostomum CBS 122681]|uniref:Zn(2)-C6 fungal-type domain-containing protein n=1 Tax=Lophiostoma macrostomum CBS 122681 TaxID=1314788 RepID=A0A6A6TRV2_9PLEO|nr:hypothetical protein K491DRAFT_281848 [Lophiostoma macrostomum CBS 122681]
MTEPRFIADCTSGDGWTKTGSLKPAVSKDTRQAQLIVSPNQTSAKRQRTEGTPDVHAWRQSQHIFRVAGTEGADTKKSVTPLPGYICFHLPDVPVEERRRAAFSKARKKEIRELRGMGACLRCRLMKKRCSKGNPCHQCLSAANTAESSKVLRWTECVRTTFQDVNLFPKIKSESEQLAFQEWQQKIRLRDQALDDLDPFENGDWLITGEGDAVAFPFIHATLALWHGLLTKLPKRAANREGFLAAVFTTWEFSQLSWRRDECCRHTQAAFDNVLRFRDAYLNCLIASCDYEFSPSQLNSAFKDQKQTSRIFNFLLTIYILVLADRIFTYKRPTTERVRSTGEALEHLLRHHLTYMLSLSLRSYHDKHHQYKHHQYALGSRARELQTFIDGLHQGTRALDPYMWPFEQPGTANVEHDKTVRCRVHFLRTRIGMPFIRSAVRNEIMRSLSYGSYWIRQGDTERVRQHMKDCPTCGQVRSCQLAVLNTQPSSFRGIVVLEKDELKGQLDEDAVGKRDQTDPDLLATKRCQEKAFGYILWTGIPMAGKVSFDEGPAAIAAKSNGREDPRQCEKLTGTLANGDRPSHRPTAQTPPGSLSEFDLDSFFDIQAFERDFGPG